jgi:hypothetical protein
MEKSKELKLINILDKMKNLNKKSNELKTFFRFY